MEFDRFPMESQSSALLLLKHFMMITPSEAGERNQLAPGVHAFAEQWTQQSFHHPFQLKRAEVSSKWQ